MASAQHTMPRKERVHITYEVETNGAMEVRELPFVMGVMGDFSGNPQEKPKSLKERKFTSIDRENFDDVMSAMKPELNIRVENTLEEDGGELAVQLKFNSMDDFDPAAVAKQIPALKALLDSREKLDELLITMDRSEDLEVQLEEILKDTEQTRALAGELGVDSKNEGGE